MARAGPIPDPHPDHVQNRRDLQRSRRVVRTDGGVRPPKPGPVPRRDPNPNVLKPDAHKRPEPGETKPSLREVAVKKLLELLDKPAHGYEHTYAEELMRRILQSEFLIGRFLDKLMPTLTPEQRSIIVQNFEGRIAELQADRARGAVPGGLLDRTRPVLDVPAEGSVPA